MAKRKQTKQEKKYYRYKAIREESKTIDLVDKNIFNGRRFKYDDPIVLENKINEYFAKCDEDSLPYTMSGLAYHLNIQRKTLLNYEKYYPTYKSLFSPVKKARQKIEAQMEMRLISGMPATGLIFNLKNNFEWKDNVQLDVGVNSSTIFDASSILSASKELLLANEEQDDKDEE